MQQLGADMGEYVLATTTETDENRMIKTPGAINGGFFPKGQGGGPSVVINVRDLNESIKKIEAAGGKIIVQPMEIPGIGTFASFTDSEGNAVSILQPKYMS
jgi:predicted enzyme related to lactoylglutathione lyase